MKNEDLRKIIREEIQSALKEEGEGEYIEKIDKSLKGIEDFLYHMPASEFARVMKRWLKYYNRYDKESLEMFHKLENSLWLFDNVLNYHGNKIPHSFYK